MQLLSTQIPRSEHDELVSVFAHKVKSQLAPLKPALQMHYLVFVSKCNCLFSHTVSGAWQTPLPLHVCGDVAGLVKQTGVSQFEPVHIVELKHVH